MLPVSWGVGKKLDVLGMSKQREGAGVDTGAGVCREYRMQVHWNPASLVLLCKEQACS